MTLQQVELMSGRQKLHGDGIFSALAFLLVFLRRTVYNVKFQLQQWNVQVW